MKKLITLLILFNIIANCINAQPDIKHSLYFKNKKCYKNIIKYYFVDFLQHSHGSLFAISGELPEDVVLSKLNTNMDTIWTKQYGGSDEDNMLHILELPNGNLLLAGTTKSKDGDVWYGHSYSAKEIWVMEVDTNGTIIKGKTFGGSNGSDLEDAIVSTDGQIYLSGTTIASDYDFTHFSFGFLDSDAWIAKLDTAFNLTWVKVYSGNGDEGGTTIQEIKPNRLIVGFLTEGTNPEMLGSQAKGGTDKLVKYIDSSGQDIWVKRFGSSYPDDSKFCVVDTATSSIYFVAGGGKADLDISYATGTGDCWILKIDTIGNILGSKMYGTIQDGMLIMSAKFFNNHIWVEGIYSNLGGGDASNNINALENVWIGMIDTNANLVGKYTINDNGADEIWGSFIYNNNLFINIRTSGNFPNNGTCNPAVDTICTYILELGVAPLSVEDINKKESVDLFTIYPNPNEMSINISFKENEKYEIVIYNEEGRRIYKNKGEEPQTQIDCRNWAKGNYLITITQNQHTQTKTFLKL